MTNASNEVLIPVGPGRLLAAACGFVAPLATSSRAWAHHAMDGRMPSSFVEGVLSGLAHPVIGPDHFVALVALGLMVIALPRGAFLAASFIAATVLGTGLHGLGIALPANEIAIGIAIACFGVLLALRAARSPQAVAARIIAMLGAGTVHGYAYGEAITGAEASPLGGYVLGCVAVQLALVLAIAAAAQAQLSSRDSQQVGVAYRIAGTLLMIAGAAWGLIEVAA